MYSIRLLLILASVLTHSSISQSFPQTLPRPNHDSCSAAQEIATLPFSGVSSNTGALPSFNNADCQVDSLARGIWYRYVPSQSANLYARMVQFRPNFEAQLTLLRGDACDNLSCRYFDRATQFSFAWSDVWATFAAAAGEPVWLLVHGADYGDDGQFRLEVTVRRYYGYGLAGKES